VLILLNVAVTLNLHTAVEALTLMVQVLFAKLLVSVSSCCNMEITLNFVSIQTSKNPTRVRRTLDPRCFAELSPLRLAQLLMHIPQLFPPWVDAVILAELMHTFLHLLACPLRPVCRVVAEEIAG
jgi:hypothetical protein